MLSSDAGSYFGTNGVPLMPSLNGRVGRITSLASIAHQAVSVENQVAILISFEASNECLNFVDLVIS